MPASLIGVRVRSDILDELSISYRMWKAHLQNYSGASFSDDVGGRACLQTLRLYPTDRDTVMLQPHAVRYDPTALGPRTRLTLPSAYKDV